MLNFIARLPISNLNNSIWWNYQSTWLKLLNFNTVEVTGSQLEKTEFEGAIFK